MALPYYVIGFNQSRRIQAFLERNSAYGDFEIVDAVPGRTLPSCLVNSFFTEGFTNYQLSKNGQPWLSNTLGCFLSHIRAIEMIANQDHDYGLICEDDARIVASPLEYIELMEQSKYDLVYLNARMKTSPPVIEEALQAARIEELVGENIVGTGGEAYVLSKRGAHIAVSTFENALDAGFPTGFDGFLQSFTFNLRVPDPAGFHSLRQGETNSVRNQVRKSDEELVGKTAASSRRWKQTKEWVYLRQENLICGLANPAIALHEDGGVSIIRGTLK